MCMEEWYDNQENISEAFGFRGGGVNGCHKGVFFKSLIVEVAGADEM